jgi:hypothetical protein
MAAFISGVLANDQLDGSLRGGAAVIAGAAVVTGVVAFAVRRHHAAMPENITANQQRRADRAAQNEAIRGRNATKIAATVLVVTPAAGVGR